MSRRRVVSTIVLGLAVAVVATGCGGSDKSSGGESEGSKTACKKPATSSATGLPAAFPVPGELTLTEVRKDGPTNVVDGYWTAGLDEAYEEFKDQVERAGYTKAIATVAATQPSVDPRVTYWWITAK